jgi:putative ABC transport system permease protein
MHFIDILRSAWEGLLANKLRALLTTLGVIIGVAAVIIMIAVSAGTEATIAERINSLGTNLLFVTGTFSPNRVGGGGAPGGAPSTTNQLMFADALALGESINGLEGVSVERNASATVKAGNISLDAVSLIGVTVDYPTVRDVPVGEGRFFNATEQERASKVAVLGYSLAQELFGETSALGQTITAGNVRLAVVGVMKEKGVVGGLDFDAQMYLPITLVFKKFTPSQLARFQGDRVNTITVKVADGASADKVIQQIELLLAQRKDVAVDDLSFTVRTQDELIETQESTTAAFRSLLAWVAGVSLVVGGIGIMNIMLVSVTERTREIGLRQAVGATPADVRWQFLAEALALSLAGGLLGVGAGVGGAWLFGQVGGMRTVVQPESIALAFSSAFAVGLFFGFYPATRAAQLDPIEALRHE